MPLCRVAAEYKVALPMVRSYEIATTGPPLSAGRRDLLRVSNLQSAQIASDEDLIKMQATQHVNRIVLYLALGGGFDASPATAITSR